jgi:serine/threonine protein kinase
MPVCATLAFLKCDCPQLFDVFSFASADSVLQPSSTALPSDSPNNGSLPYMAPEIFQHTKQALVAPSPLVATPAAQRVTAIADSPLPAATPSGLSQKESEERANKQRDIWAFGCVLYEIATHRRPWYHVLEASGSASSPLVEPAAPPPMAHFVRGLWKNLGAFHGG